MTKFGSYLQTNWDWRAAGNFMFGGTGSALIVMTAVASYPAAPPLALVLPALALVGLGLFLVWLEIGRPWRFLHVFFHPHTSWMTREGSVAMLLFPVALIAVAMGSGILIACAGILAAAFLYCQGRILKASKGIPAWREPAIVPFIIGTGLAEGCALVLLVLTLTGGAPDWLVWALLVFLGFRSWSWISYQTALAAPGVPPGARHAIKKANPVFLLAGNIVPALALVLPGATIGRLWLLLAACVLTVAAGWYVKYVIVAKAAFVQGYGLGKLRKGRPRIKPPVRRKGDPVQF
jgi:phenylacetyl-CoA:acceptor oxidoreductase subunit 2